MYSVWASLIWKAPEQWTPKDYTLSMIYTRTRLRCRRVLEHLFRVQSAEVFECVVDWWSRDHSVSDITSIGARLILLAAVCFISLCSLRTCRHSPSKRTKRR